MGGGVYTNGVHFIAAEEPSAEAGPVGLVEVHIVEGGVEKGGSLEVPFELSAPAVKKDFLKGEIVPTGIEDEKGFFLPGEFASVEVRRSIVEGDGIEFQTLCLKEGIGKVSGPSYQTRLRKIHVPALKDGMGERKEVKMKYAAGEQGPPGLKGRVGPKSFLSLQTASFEGD